MLKYFEKTFNGFKQIANSTNCSIVFGIAPNTPLIKAEELD